MPLSPEQEWTLVACGLMAHADGVLDVEEWDQVLWMIDERLEGEEVEPWKARIADVANLRAYAEGLALPPPLFSQTILEKAWRVALADGYGSPEEASLHDELAEQLGIDQETIGQWRATWTANARRRSELIAGFAALIARADDVVTDAERSRFVELLARLPMTEERRAELRGLVDDPPELMQLVGGFTALAPEERAIAMVGLAPIVAADDRGTDARSMFIELAGRVAITREDAERLLER